MQIAADNLGLAERELDAHVGAIDPLTEELRGHDEGVPRLGWGHRIFGLEGIIGIDQAEVGRLDRDQVDFPFFAKNRPRVEPSDGFSGIQPTDGLSGPTLAVKVLCLDRQVWSEGQGSKGPIDFQGGGNRPR